MRRPTTLACSAERSRSVSKLETWKVCSTRSSGGERRKRCKTCLCIAWLSLGFYSLSDWFLLSLLPCLLLVQPFPPIWMAAASVISCSTKNVKMSSQVGLQCHRVARDSRVRSQALTEGREHKNNPPEKLCSFLDPLMIPRSSFILISSSSSLDWWPCR
jgi:hypothetical protein